MVTYFIHLNFHTSNSDLATLSGLLEVEKHLIQMCFAGVKFALLFKVEMFIEKTGAFKPYAITLS